MKSAKAWPRTITEGSVSVKVYEVNHATAATGKAYVVAWTTPSGRQTKKFANANEAVEEARLQAQKIATGRVEAGSMSRADFEELAAAKAITGATPLLSALEEWKAARAIAGAHVVAACETWAAKNGTAYDPITVSEAVKRFLAAKKRDGVDVTASYNKILPSVVQRFGDRLIPTINSKELGEWFRERFSHPVSRNTCRQRCVTLWRWCRDEHYLPRGIETEAELTKPAIVADSPIGIISAATYSSLLNYFREKHPEYLAPLLLAGFCGLRRSEVHSQQWEGIDLQKRHVRVTRVKRRTPANRLVSISRTAIKWFLLSSNRTGPICSNLAIDRIRDIAREARIDGQPLFPNLPENCFRHSFISHRVAQTGNVAATSLEAGNTPKIIFRHYRELVSKAEGKKWFSISPDGEKLAEVLPIEGKAANA